MLVLTAGFSLYVLAEQDNKIITSELGSLDSETIMYEVSPDNDDTDSISSILFVDTLDQQQTNDSNYAVTVTGNASMAQSFIPTLETLTRVELKLYKKGTLDTLIISIKSNLTGPDLTWIYLPGNSLPITKTWVECDFPDVSVTPGDTYYIVWDTLGGHDQDNNSYWCFGINNPYLNGLIKTRLDDVWRIWNPGEFPDPDFCFKTYGRVNNPPNKPNQPSGEIKGKIGQEYSYTTSTIDPDGDQVNYLWEWGDGDNSGWLGPYNSGVLCEAKHTWNTKNNYNIKVKAKDSHGAESLWSEPLPITMPYSYKPIHQSFKWLYQRYLETLDGTITINPAKPNGNFEWYITPVYATFHAQDDIQLAYIYYKVTTEGQADPNWTQVDIRNEHTAKYNLTIKINIDGVHYANFYAVDHAGNIGPVHTSNWIQIDMSPPKVNFSKENISFYKIKFTADATDITSGIHTVKFYVDDNTEPANEDTTSPYEFIWNEIGNHTITAKAYDFAGNEADTEMSTPTKKTEASCFGGITSPAPGHLYLFGDQLFPLKSGKTICLFGGIEVAANFTAEGAPMRTVQFYLDDVLMNEDTTAPYSVTLSTKHSGPATIKVTAIDILGRSASDTLYIDNYLKLIE